MSHISVPESAAARLRATVSPALTQEGLARFAALLDSFQRRYPRAAGDISRFEFLLDEMFDVFVSLNVETTPEGAVVDCLPMADNFDTGNAGVRPFPPFVQGVQEAFADLDDYRIYVGPRPIAGLPEAVKGWLAHHGFITPQRSAELALAVGVGTVHLYDVLCRALIQRAGDIFIIPEVTYGFFIPQIERNGGRAYVLAAQNGQKITAAEAAAVAERLNTSAALEWRKTARQRLDIYVTEIEGRFGRAVRRPDDEQLSQLCDSLAVLTSPLEMQAQMERFIYAEMCCDDAELYARVMTEPQMNAHFPPRVVAYLHINPNLYGKIYEPDEEEALTHALAERAVTLIEDVAYHSLGRSVANLKSCLNFGSNVFSLIGVSKPLAIANCRLGILLGEASAMTGLYRLLENSVGFVSTLLQRGLLRAFSEPATLDLYLAGNWTAPDGYRHKRNLLIACLEGCASPILEPEWGESGRRAVADGVLEFFAWKRSQGVELFDPDYLFPDGTRATDPADFQSRVAASFSEEGLSRWLEVCAVPDCGFFIIVDCRKLLHRWRSCEPRLTCAFDVFAMFAMLFGVRTIPEECMGDLGFSGAYRLRLSYSVQAETIIRACVTLYLGLAQLERSGVE